MGVDGFGAFPMRCSIRLVGSVIAFALSATLALAEDPVPVPTGVPAPPVADMLPPPVPSQETTPAPTPTPPPVPAPPAYFVVEGGQQIGPFLIEQMRERFAAGTLKGDTLIWNPSLPAWTPARDVADIAALFSAGPPSPPPVPDGVQQQQLDAQIKQFILGEWSTDGPAANLPGGRQQLVLRYNADGTFRGFQTIIYGGATTQIPSAGTWTVQAMTDRKFTFTSNAEGALVPFSAVFVIIDENTLQNEKDATFARRTAR